MCRFLAPFLALLTTLPGSADTIVPRNPPKPLPPLEQAHAHNDYYHKRPLLDALAQGFCSVEADIFLVDGELRVGHSRFELREGRTLESLYLKPLTERVGKGKHVYPKTPEKRFVLLIDIKRDGKKVYPVLDQLLEKYQHLFVSYSDGNVRPGPVMAILSGDRPRALVEADATRHCSLDGRPPDLGTKAASTLIPLISDKWSNHFKWRGRGEFPAEERAKLKAFVKRTHAEQRILRFWAVPDRPEAWKVLHEEGVDLINTDKLAELSKFLRAQSK